MSLMCVGTYAQQLASAKPPSIPAPIETIQDVKQFNAVRLGPGNAIAVVQTPPDFQLNTFAISGNGGLLAMGWASRRIEIWDTHTRRRISQFKSDVGAPQVMLFDAPGDEFIITGSGGTIAFLSLPSGKRLREWKIPLGKYKYDLNSPVLGPRDAWLAYADEDSSKVLDLMATKPRTLANLGDAGSLALSQDGTALWAVDRTQLERFDTASWQQTGRWPLKAPPVADCPLALETGIGPNGEQTVAVPSNKGLVIYTYPRMTGDYVTNNPSCAVAYAPASHTYVNLSDDLTISNAIGTVLCTRSYEGRSAYAISSDGQWLALAQSDHVNLWRMKDLLHQCSSSP
ncbi:MAG: WD40 repeat domain-containing protein [Candidatus Acidiferrales bacterium]